MRTTEEKNNLAIELYERVLLNSWTYNRMTEEEKNRLNELMNRVFNEQGECYRLTGTEKQRRAQVNLIYSAFLSGLGYDGFMWREDAKQ